MSAIYLVWKAYQRRAETLAPKLGAELIYMPHVFRRRMLRPLDYLGHLVSTARLLLVHRPAIVYVQAPPLYAALMPLLFRIPYVLDTHNGIWQTHWGRLPLSRLILRNAKAVIVHNDEIKAIARLRLPDLPIVTVRDPVNSIRNPVVARHANRILFICSFDAGEPVQILADIVQSLPDYEFYITADRAKLARGVRDGLKGLPNLTFTGFLPTEQYQKLLCSSAAAVVLEELPSTQPSGACEALSSDTPLVVSRTALTEALFGTWARLVRNRPEEIVAAIRHSALRPLDLSLHRRIWNEDVDAGLRELADRLAVTPVYATRGRVPVTRHKGKFAAAGDE